MCQGRFSAAILQHRTRFSQQCEFFYDEPFGLRMVVYLKMASSSDF